MKQGKGYYVVYDQLDYCVQYYEDARFNGFDSSTAHGPFDSFSYAKREALIMARGDRDDLRACIKRLLKTTKADI